MTEPRQDAALDREIEDLRAGLPRWLGLSIDERIELLRNAKRRVVESTPAIAEAVCAATGVPPGSLWAGDERALAAVMTLHLRARELALSRIAAHGDAPLPEGAFSTRPDGQVTVSVVPSDWFDRVANGEIRASVWLQPGVDAQAARSECAAAYRGGSFDRPGVALLLAAGNASPLAGTDALNLLFAEGSVALVKMNPVNAYLRPILERVLADFVEAGWLRFVDGGADVGAHLAHHEGVDRLHLTGSRATYEAIVQGTDRAGARQGPRTPQLAKPFTAELGGVGPTIVAPGRWTRHDLRRWADRLAIWKMFNCGHACNSPQVLILPEGWEQADLLLADLRYFLGTTEPRAPFYPGTVDRIARAIADHPDAESLGHAGRYLVGLDPDEDASLFRDEVFAEVLGVVRLPAPTLEAYLAAATEFANDRLAGTLAAQLVVDDSTQRSHPSAVDRCVAGLHYGAIGVNEFAVNAYALGSTTWGGFPGHTPEEIGSGVGVVGNAFGLPKPERTVLNGAFRPRIKPLFSATHTGRGPAFSAVSQFSATGDPRALVRAFAAALRP